MKKTFKYLKKSFLALSLAAIIPSLLLGSFLPPLTPFTFLPVYFKSASGSFSDVFWMLISFSALKKVFPYILIIAALILGLSYGLGIIEKHFKTGKLAISNPVRAINNTMLSVLKTLPIFLIIMLIVFLVQSGVVALFRLIISGTHNYPRPFDCVWVSLLSFGVFIFLTMLSLIMAVWAVIMQIYGYSFADAFVESMRTISKKWFQLVLGLFIPLVVLCIPQIIINSLEIKTVVVTVTASTLTHLVMLVYFLAYVIVAVYELNGLQRRDEKKYYLP